MKVNLSIMKRPSERIPELYKKLKNIASKLHRTAGSVGFIKKAFPKFHLWLVTDFSKYS